MRAAFLRAEVRGEESPGGLATLVNGGTGDLLDELAQEVSLNVIA